MVLNNILKLSVGNMMVMRVNDVQILRSLCLKVLRYSGIIVSP